MISMRTLTLSILLFVVVTQPAVAQVSPLETIPDSAAVVVRLQAPEATIDTVAVFVNKVQPGIGDIVKAQLKPALGRAAFNPGLAGVDQTKDWYAVLFVDENQKPQRAVLLPTTDAAAAKKAMGTKFDFVEKDGWLACTTLRSKLQHSMLQAPCQAVCCQSLLLGRSEKRHPGLGICNNK
jgi:hypothetical protein